ncbi:MAG: ABC transporter substrate-binding protein [Clostridia bacterium]|nr:ABC transporter substrate-binding protein [Clostridia bacterium]
MKKALSLLFVLILSLSFVSCGRSTVSHSPGSEPALPSVTDALGNTVSLPLNARVVSCYASFTDCWLLSGGSVVGVTDDAVEEGIVSSDQALSVGSVKHVNLEQVLSLNPDYVILSADLAAHLQLEAALKAARICYGYFRVDTFGDYRDLMKQFCAVNGGRDRYDTYVTDVETQIRSVLNRIPENTESSVLLLRVYSTGMKAKTDDNLAGQILKELGLRNVADETPSLLEDLSVEKILLEDPDYIVFLTMGDEVAAMAFLQQNVENHPAWTGLSAVKNETCFLLPKDLFHYKPNERWGESYEYLAKRIYPEIFGE